MEAVARPLYIQVRDALMTRIADGEWKAGAPLPSEFALAGQMGVSQGTVRKALDAMAADNLVVRRQGRGTYVPEHTEARALFHFFRMQDETGAPVVPRPLSQQIAQVEPPPGFGKLLGSGRRKLWRITRVRAVMGRPAILEKIYLDPRRFAALRADATPPNALYGYYQSIANVTVARAEDQLTATTADSAVAALLEVAPGTPLLLSNRRAHDMRGAVVELRQSWFHTSQQSYAVTLK